MVYTGLGQEVPSDFDETILALIYENLEMNRYLVLTRRQESELWAPVVARLERMRGDPIQALPLEAPIDVDVVMGDASDQEIDQGQDREE